MLLTRLCWIAPICLLLAGCAGAAQSPPELSATAKTVTDLRLEATAMAAQATPASAPPTATPDPFPTPVRAQVYVAEQRFEGGWMLWLQPVAQIWLLTVDDGAHVWTARGDSFVDGEAESDPQIAPPAGKLQPVRGFGKLWREDPQVRHVLGWALAAERGYMAHYEYHHGGHLNAAGKYEPAPGFHRVRSDSGAVFMFFEASKSWKVES